MSSRWTTDAGRFAEEKARRFCIWEWLCQRLKRSVGSVMGHTPRCGEPAHEVTGRLACGSPTPSPAGEGSGVRQECGGSEPGDGAAGGRRRAGTGFLQEVPQAVEGTVASGEKAWHGEGGLRGLEQISSSLCVHLSMGHVAATLRVCPCLSATPCGSNVETRGRQLPVGRDVPPAMQEQRRAPAEEGEGLCARLAMCRMEAQGSGSRAGRGPGRPGSGCV